MGEEYYGGDGSGDLPQGNKMTNYALIAGIGGFLIVGFFCAVGIIAAIAIPSMVEPRKMGNEASAIGGLKSLTIAQTIYMEADKDGDGKPLYGNLQALGRYQLIDQSLASGTKQGYRYECWPNKKGTAFWAKASPSRPGETGDRYFFVNQEGGIYYSEKDFKVDPKSCKVPNNMQPVGR